MTYLTTKNNIIIVSNNKSLAYFMENFSVFLSGAGVCMFSLVCGLVLGFLDKRAARILKKEDSQTGMSLG